MWQVYILKCADGSLYTGITTDIKRRIVEHNSSTLGAKYTRGRRSVKLVCVRRKKNRSLAAKEEWRIKKMTKTEKISYISTYPQG
ncbi:MAG: GIY-YIG nuclease family protein [bacterium]|nr:GIY-YIG nuclease family protein [bacterium]